MLNKLRNKKTAKKIWIVLAILVLPAFVLWGSASMIGDKKTVQITGVISGKRITPIEFRDSLNAVKNQGLMQFGENFYEIEKSLGLEAQAWERLVLLAEAKKRRLSVTDKEVITQIESYPFFANKGVFDNRIYNQMVNFVFHTQPRVFEEETRQNLLIAKLYKDVTRDIKTTDKEVEEKYKESTQELSIDYIAAIYSDISKTISVNDDQINDYFLKNTLQFRLPLSFNLEYVEFVLPDKDEKSAKDKINKIYAKLNKKSPFTEVAKENSLAIKETGFFPETGPIPGIGWATPVLNMLTGLKTGQYLPPLRMDNAYYILRVKERKEPYIPEFTSVKERVKEAFLATKSKTLAREKMDQCFKNLTTFEKAAKEYELKAGSTGMFKYSSYIEGIGASDKFWLVAHGLEKDKHSDIIEMPAGLYIIKLKSITPFDDKKFQAEKEEFTDKLLSQKKKEKFLKLIDELQKNARPYALTPR